MLKFVALLSQKNTKLFTEELLQRHINHLQSLYDAGLLVLCGPFTDNDSAIQIIIAKNISEAERIVYQDPFIQSNYYNSVEVKELIEANPGNNWLTSHPQTEEKRNK